MTESDIDGTNKVGQFKSICQHFWDLEGLRKSSLNGQFFAKSKEKLEIRFINCHEMLRTRGMHDLGEEDGATDGQLFCRAHWAGDSLQSLPVGLFVSNR